MTDFAVQGIWALDAAFIAVAPPMIHLIHGSFPCRLGSVIMCEVNVMNARRRVWLGGVMVLLAWSAAGGQDKPAAFQPPEDIAFRNATIISEGVRMAAEVFALKESRDQPLPTIIMCHGTIPGITHYGIYGEAREQSQKLAIEWFDTHLKGD